MDHLQLKKERRNLLKKVAELQGENEMLKKQIAGMVASKLKGGWIKFSRPKRDQSFNGRRWQAIQ